MGVLKSAVSVLILAVILTKIPDLMKSPKSIPKPQGYVAPGWEGVEKAFRENFEVRGEQGGAFAVYHKGELVVDLRGGLANELTNEPWKEDTVTRLYSSSKGIGAIVMAMLVDRGLMAYEEKVSTYWPEFAANGKQDVTVAQLLSHQAGLYAFDEQYSEHDTLNDWPKIKRIMENQKPHWTPGETHGYHGLTIGLFMDQLVRLRDPKHRTIAQYFEEEVAKPFGIDVSFGLRKSEHHRCTWMVTVNPGLTELLKDPSKITRMFNMMFSETIKKLTGNPKDAIVGPAEHGADYRLITNPSHAAYGSASGVAKLYGILTNGAQYKGKTLFKNKKIIEQLNTIFTKGGKDHVLDMELDFGYGVTPLATPQGGVMFGTPGYGGQICYGDTKNNLGFALITNYLDTSVVLDFPKLKAVKNAMYQSLKYIKK